MPDASTTYWDYLKLLPLLELQGGLDGDDSRVSEDELHFIVVHQVFELWMKLVLRELRMARDRLVAEWVPERHLPHIVRHLRRVIEIFKLSIDSFAVLETLTPQDFLAFRKKLGESSGFQSFQMREMEVLLGWQFWDRPVDPVSEIAASAGATPRGASIVAGLKQARSEPTLREALVNWLSRTPIQGSLPKQPGDEAAVREFAMEYQRVLSNYDPALAAEFPRFVKGEKSDPAAERARIGLLFIESYRDLPLLSWPYVLIESVVEMEEQLVLWRTRHARMVERMIGRRMGTGGSAGFSYLDATTQHRIFGELWAVRTLLLPRDRVPELRCRDIYELKAPTADETT
jgi:tryptophan 2,3-dioxygenase